jgi:putative transcriptional regulator
MFTNRIGYWAKMKGVKQNYLAGKCEVSIQTFSRWVNNITQPDLKAAYIIAQSLSITVDQLINKEEEEE